MQLLWRYLRPLARQVLLALFLAALAQILGLLDPIILGRIIDQYVLNPNGLPEAALIQGAIVWLLIAIGVALGARLAQTFQSYVLQFIVQSVGMQLFNDGLRKTLQLSYQEDVAPADRRARSRQRYSSSQPLAAGRGLRNLERRSCI